MLSHLQRLQHRQPNTERLEHFLHGSVFPLPELFSVPERCDPSRVGGGPQDGGFDFVDEVQ